MTSIPSANARDAARRSPPTAKACVTLLVALLWVQGLYGLVTGVWPLMSIETFQMVTGRKTDHLVTGREGDHWLVMTVGVLVVCIALALLAGALQRRVTPEVVILAITSALGLAAIDVIYVVRQVILPIYLADAALEVLFITAWTFLLFGYSRYAKAGMPNNS